jgi:TetR/AcrR family transcriptional regulator
MDMQTTGFARDFQHSQRLFDAALEEFCVKGYDRASINTILHTAGMSKGQFYYHFANKEALYLALIGVLIEQKQAFMSATMQPDDFLQDIFGILRTQIRYGRAFAAAYPAINRFAESFIKEQGNPIYAKALAIYNFDDNAAIDRLVTAAYERGDFRDDLPLTFIRSIIGYLFTHAVEVAGLDTPDSFEERMAYLIEVLRSGLQHRTDASS